jgi:2-polyprenyl-3-methyl-5-hydroxy-6-metoxy-1,4-benzoquinol methylase
MQTSSIVYTFCPVCDADNIHPVLTARDHTVSQKEFEIWECAVCSFRFTQHVPDANAIKAYYQSENYISHSNTKKGLVNRLYHFVRKQTLARKRRLVVSASKSGSKILLDIGAGTGQFLHHARMFFTEVAGTEVSESAVRIAREKYGIELFAGQVEELAMTPGSFANITLFHVLEHVPDPAGLVNLCRELLRPQGVLAIAVPNDILAWSSKIKKLGKRVGLRPFQKFSPVLGVSRAGASREVHLSHFTPAVLRQLVKSSGLTIMEESIDPYYVSGGVRLLADSAYYALHKVLKSTLKVNYYDTIWMIARKP